MFSPLGSFNFAKSCTAFCASDLLTFPFAYLSMLAPTSSASKATPCVPEPSLLPAIIPATCVPCTCVLPDVDTVLSYLV